MKSFDDWFKELTSDTRWVELLRHYRDDTIKKAGEKVFDELVTLKTLGHRTIEEDRLHVYRVCKKLPEDKVLKPFVPKVPEVKQPEAPSLTGEARQQKLKEWEAIVKGSTMANSMPKPSYKQLAEEGGVLPPKPAPHPSTSFNEAYAKEKHIAYVKANYDPRTREKLPGWVPEEEFVWISKKQFSKTI